MKNITRHNYEAYFLDYLEGELSGELKLEMEAFLKANPDLAVELEEFENVSLEPEGAHAKWDGLKIPNVQDLAENEALREQLYFRCAEGQANGHDEKLLAELLAHEQFQKEYTLWTKLKLVTTEEWIDREGLYQLPLVLPVTSVNFEDFLIARAEGILSEEENQELEKYAASLSEGERELALADSLRLETPTGIFYPFKKDLKKKKKGLILFYRAAAILLLFGLSASLFTLLNREGSIEHRYAQREIVEISPDSTDILETELELNEDTIPKVDQYKLEEWEVREPDPVFVAENAETPPEEKVDPIYQSVEEEFDEIEFAEVKPVEIAPEVEVDIVEPKIEMEDGNEVFLAQETTQDKPDETSAAYQTIGEAAQNRVAEEFNLSENEKDELALSVAKRIAQKAGETLDAEVKKETDEDSDRLTYSLRIRGFKVSHSKSK